MPGGARHLRRGVEHRAKRAAGYPPRRTVCTAIGGRADPDVNVDRPILVIGATRGTGREIVSRLPRDGHLVRALARDASSAKLMLPQEIEIAEGDVTKPATLAEALNGVSNVIFTASVTKRPASEQSIVAVEYHGVTNTLSAAKATAFAGRFLYMTTIGVTRHSIESIGLNLIKGNTMK